MKEEKTIFVDVSTPDTPAYKIFHKPFETKIQRLHLLSKCDIEIFGVPSSGNKNVDDSNLREYIHCSSTIWEMTEYHSKGIPFIIVNLEDTVLMYDLLYQHLKGHLDKVTNSINLGDVPIDDLMKMDAFAGVVFNFAKPYGKPATMQLPVGLREMLARGPKMSSGLRPDPIVESTVVPTEAKHNPLANQIAKHFQERNKMPIRPRGWRES